MGTIEELIGVIEEEFEEIESGSLSPGVIIQEVLSLTSLNMAIMLTCIELEFDTIVTVAEVKACETFQDLFILIQHAKANA